MDSKISINPSELREKLSGLRHRFTHRYHFVKGCQKAIAESSSDDDEMYLSSFESDDGLIR